MSMAVRAPCFSMSVASPVMPTRTHAIAGLFGGGSRCPALVDQAMWTHRGSMTLNVRSRILDHIAGGVRQPEPSVALLKNSSHSMRRMATANRENTSSRASAPTSGRYWYLVQRTDIPSRRQFAVLNEASSIPRASRATTASVSRLAVSYRDVLVRLTSRLYRRPPRTFARPRLWA